MEVRPQEKVNFVMNTNNIIADHITQSEPKAPSRVCLFQRGTPDSNHQRQELVGRRGEIGSGIGQGISDR